MSRASRLVIVGAAGDLTGRYLLPALASLTAGDLLPGDADIVGVAPVGWDDEAFRRHAASKLEQHRSELSGEARQGFCRRLSFVDGDGSDPDVLRRAAGGASGPVVFYLALPPSLFEPVITAIASAGAPGDARVVVEKPFGEDLEGALRLNRLLSETFAEDHVFRIDHFLGMQTVQNVLGIRFGNRIFEPLWCSDHVEAVSIVWDETVALEGRAGYYDRAGAVRDMVQNHLMQLLALVAMEQPASLDEGDLRDAKVDVLRRVQRLSADDVARQTRRARYTAGRVGDRELPSYANEEGIDPGRGTETFADVTLFLDDDRWRGVPFRLRTGKALGQDRHEIRIRFRPPSSALFDWGPTMPANELTMTIEPDTLVLDVALNAADDPTELDPAQLRADCAPQELPAYARLLLDIFDGNPAFSTRGDEAEESWRIVEPILAAWRDGAVPLEEYEAGSAGPA